MLISLKILFEERGVVQNAKQNMPNIKKAIVDNDNMTKAERMFIRIICNPQTQLPFNFFRAANLSFALIMCYPPFVNL